MHIFSVYSQFTRVSIGSCTTSWTLSGSVSERRFPPPRPDQMMFCDVGQVLCEEKMVFSNNTGMFKEARGGNVGLGHTIRKIKPTQTNLLTICSHT